ncbi:YlbD family protein [Bacillus shivajii]|uniref:YlbD family protein n=1 Tax=Bacillus shivajii TaxID=1983719 RepID=UPI001CFAE263|nr:YlbD family protein [Bacillus shivajii]UCZ51854.1 YlbD family protein [Bacillus shivajii]
MKNSLHPDVQKFKLFVKTHPYVLRDVKTGDKTLQDLFEEWKLFGEDDEIWETYKAANKTESNNDERKSDESSGEETSSEGISTQDLLAMLKKMNLNDLQHHLSQFSGVLSSVQELLGQFKQSPPEEQGRTEDQQSSPFSFRED